MNTNDLTALLQTSPQQLARLQHDALKEHALSRLRAITALLENESYDALENELGYSSSGDAMGHENHYICFNLDSQGIEDIGDVVERLKHLQAAIPAKKPLIPTHVKHPAPRK